MLNIKIKSHDGKEFGAYLAKANKPKAASIVVIQEIFGVNAGLVHIADTWAARGYHAIVPDLFWRMQPGVEISDKTDAEWKQAFGFYQKFDKQNGLKDLITTLNYARGMEGASSKGASMGYCLGGLMAFNMAVHSDADCNVSYYGGGIENELAGVPDIKRPLLMHLAGNDEHMGPDAQAKIKAAVEKNSNVTLQVYPGTQHAFARVNGVHENKEAAQLADKRTQEFFAKNLA
jgi:carboxymethylenebutenolidase